MLSKILDIVPKFLLGPLAVVLGILYFYFQDPPKTICDTQFEYFKKENLKYLYGTTKKNIKVPALYLNDLDMCRKSNSVGGCYDWMQGLKKTISSSRSLAGEECRPRISELNPLIPYYASSLRVYAQISWNDTEVVRAKLFHWLDSEDLIVYCRLKTEYTRLMGVPAYQALEASLFKELLELKKLSKEEAWPRTVLSHNCTII